MSWFETVKNVAKTVAENIAKTSIGTGGIPCAGASIAGAVPSTHSGLWSYLKRPSISVSDSDSDSDSQEEASSSTNVVEQVTTRARYTYELDSEYLLCTDQYVPNHGQTSTLSNPNINRDKKSITALTMSWLDTLKYVAKTVVKSINTVTGGPSIDRSHVLPYRDNSDSDESEGASVSARITTRARMTYELDRFQKNALLMFVQMRSESSAGSRVEETTTQDINILQDTLNGFRFEVTTYIDLSCSEIENKCQEFFQQNFSQYGAVIVVVLTFQGGTDQLSALDGSFSENIILRHFTNDLNLTLHGKPKIYITETHRILSSESEPRISIPLEENEDVLGLHFPTIDHQTTVRRPMVVLCDNIKEMADTHDFATILKKSVEEIKTSSSVFENSPIELSINLAKEMMLARSAE